MNELMFDAKQRMTRKLLVGVLAGSMLASLSAGVTAEETETSESSGIKNMILLIPDGMPHDATTLARWYKGASLNLDSMASGLVRTYSADAAIADSAPAGTAFATGHKSHTGYVGVLPDKATMPGQQAIAPGDERRPVASVLEGAKLQGKSTGIISTSEIMHATPAAFTSHYPARSNYDALSMQQVYNGVDVVLGGGSSFLSGEGRKDGQNLIASIKALGYDYVTTPQQLQASESGKLWGMFSPTALSYNMDRNPEEQPSLAEMTKKAIDVLSADEDGFFLMVEGSKVDWAAHANDPMGILSDVLAFDDAVKVAKDFAEANGETAVIAVTDHHNGGLTIGNRETTKTYDTDPLSKFIAPLKRAKLTGEGLAAKFNENRTNIQQVMREYYGITDLTKEEIQAIREAELGRMNYVVGPMISNRAYIGWTTGGHTGGDVVLYTYVPEGQHRLMGVVENTDIAKYIASELGFDLGATTQRLFVDAKQAFAAIGATVSTEADQLVVTLGNNKLVLPFHKNVALHNGNKVMLEGVVVFNGERTYVPQQAVDLLKAN
ncbi:alkaline phosphatase [Paenibacillus sp. 598K]|nr:alkaline phosphatase [Paenibacillus sp. 598K]